MKTILAFDDFVLNRNDNTRRVFHQPDWQFDLAYTDPNIPRAISPASVIPAPQGGYYMYYMGIPEGLDLEGDEHLQCFLAHSNDGLRFEPYDHVSPGGVLPNRLGYSHEPIGIHAFYDANEPNPEKRYKAAYPRYGYDANGNLVEEAARLLASPDGIHWTCISEAPVTPSFVDCYLSLAHNPMTGHYQVTTRRRWGERRICLTESEDFSSWSEPRAIVHPLPDDEPTTHLYSMPHYYYRAGDVFIGLLWRQVMPFNRVMDGPVTTEYAYSYDGLMWNRTGAILMDRQDRGTFGGGSSYVFSMVERADDILFYANAYVCEHGGVPGGWKPGMPRQSAVVPGTLKRNRFVGIDSNKGGMGELITQHLRLKDPYLKINANIPYGSLRAQLVAGGPIEGFTFDDFLPIQGDRLDAELRWQGGRLNDLIESGRWLQLHIRFDQAEVFTVSGDFDFTINTRAPVYERL